MEKLSKEDIDKELIDRDERKPLRKVIDDKVIPVGKVLAGGVIGTVGALANIKDAPKLHTID